MPAGKAERASGPAGGPDLPGCAAPSVPICLAEGSVAGAQGMLIETLIIAVYLAATLFGSTAED